MPNTADDTSASSAKRTDNGAPLMGSPSASLRTPDQTVTTADDDMLTVDFSSTPLAGAARAARLRQMTEKHVSNLQSESLLSPPLSRRFPDRHTLPMVP